MIRFKQTAILTIVGAFSVSSAQDQPKKEMRVEVRGSVGVGVGAGAPEDMKWFTSYGPAAMAAQATFQFIAAEAGQPGKLVTGAPYTGEGVSETIQTLADGTRITRRNSTSYARDSEGRVREERTLAAIGPWASSGEPHRLITIHDPVAKETIILDEKERTARRMKMPDPAAIHHMKAFREMKAFGERKRGKAKAGEDVETVVRGGFSGTVVAAGEQPHIAFLPAPASGAIVHRQDVLIATDEKNIKQEALGRQTMEGLSVEGSRTIRTIPANEIGNDRDIVSTTERWTSPELQVMVRSVTKDPQFGEMNYRLTNVRRGEPDKSLFQIPAGYTVTDPGTMFREFERKIKDEPF